MLPRWKRSNEIDWLPSVGPVFPESGVPSGAVRRRSAGDLAVTLAKLALVREVQVAGRMQQSLPPYYQDASFTSPLAFAEWLVLSTRLLTPCCAEMAL